MSSDEQQAGSPEVSVRFPSDVDGYPNIHESVLYFLLASQTKDANSFIDARGDLNIQEAERESKRSGNSEVDGMGQRIFMRWSVALHGFVCAPGGEDERLRESIVAAIIGKSGGATALVAGALVSAFGISPILAALVAALLIKVIVAPAGQELCGTWSAFNKKSSPTS